MPEAWSRWRALSASEKRLLASMSFLLPVFSVSLRLAGYRRTHALVLALSRPGTFRKPGPGDLLRAEHIAQLAELAGRRGAMTSTCLPQALLVQWWLRRGGWDAHLKFGARKQEGRFDAHAWVEFAGKPLNQPDHDYATFGEPGESAG